MDIKHNHCFFFFTFFIYLSRFTFCHVWQGDGHIIIYLIELTICTQTQINSFLFSFWRGRRKVSK